MVWWASFSTTKLKSLRQEILVFQSGQESQIYVIDSHAPSQSKLPTSFNRYIAIFVRAKYMHNTRCTNQFLNSHCPRGVWLRRGAGLGGSGCGVWCLTRPEGGHQFSSAWGWSWRGCGLIHDCDLALGCLSLLVGCVVAVPFSHKGDRYIFAFISVDPASSGASLMMYRVFLSLRSLAVSRIPFYDVSVLPCMFSHRRFLEVSQSACCFVFFYSRIGSPPSFSYVGIPTQATELVDCSGSVFWWYRVFHFRQQLTQWRARSEGCPDVEGQGRDQCIRPHPLQLHPQTLEDRCPPSGRVHTPQSLPPRSAPLRSHTPCGQWLFKNWFCTSCILPWRRSRYSNQNLLAA